MSVAWVVPAGLTVIGLTAVVAVARRITEQAAGLRRDLAELASLRPALVEVRRSAEEAGAAARRLRSW